MAVGPSTLLIVIVNTGPGWRLLASFFRWFDYGPESLLLLGLMAILHGVLVGAVAIDSGRLGLGRRLRLASGAIFLAPVTVIVDVATFVITWFLVAALST